MSASSIATETQVLTNADIKLKTDSYLKTAGFTAGEIASIQSLYANIIDGGDVAILEAKAAEVLGTADETAESISEAESQNSGKSTEGGNNYDPQDVNYPHIKPEPAIMMGLGTEIPPFSDAGYLPSEDYPETTAKIDKALNWVKINKVQKYVEFVHSSGTSLKVNKYGDVSLNIVGNFKVTVQKDLHTSVYGNEGKLNLGNIEEVISGYFKSVISGTSDTTVEEDATITNAKKMSHTVLGEATISVLDKLSISATKDFSLSSLGTAIISSIDSMRIASSGILVISAIKGFELKSNMDFAMTVIKDISIDAVNVAITATETLSLDGLVIAMTALTNITIDALVDLTMNAVAKISAVGASSFTSFCNFCTGGNTK